MRGMQRGGDVSLERISDLQAAVIGGDTRQVAVAEALANEFKTVKLYGHIAAETPTAVLNTASLLETLSEVRVVVLPISGMNVVGMVRGRKIGEEIDFGSCLNALSPGTLIVTGSLTSDWLQRCSELRLQIVQYAEDDEIAILNSIPTAEGALQIALEEMPITIHDSTVLVLGFGRVGMTVARTFKALGARVKVAARRNDVLARAWELGCDRIPLSTASTLGMETLNESIANIDLILNTIPALIMDSTLLAKISSRTLIIDLASPPGGTDFEAAKQFHIRAILAPGLPGKVAPQTAGAILVETIPRLIRNSLYGGDR